MLLIFGVLLQVAAQTPDAGSRIRRDAGAAQARFERVRRTNLPREFGGRLTAPCDATIGRYCYWYDSTSRNAVPEPKRITAARDELLGVLDSAAALNPSDGWIAGQRVRYLLEAARSPAAVDVARACGAERWWCAALQGLALHAAERYAAADSAFAVALTEMTEQRRCEWLDIRLVVPARLERELVQATCTEHGTLANRLWRLAQPLWSTPGNDLRNEHFARLTMAEILARSDNVRGTRWSGDDRELLLRYGWAEWHTRQDLSPYMMASPSITGHDREPSYYFFPDVATVHRVPRVTAQSWLFREPKAVTRYAPRHIERLTELPHQLMRFPRGDSMFLAAVYRPSDSVLVRDSVDARIVALVGDDIVMGSATSGHVVSMMVPRDTVIVSVEVHGAKSRHAARARYTVEPQFCASWCVSDLLLFRPRDTADSTMEDALRHGLAEMSQSSRDPLGILWEIQGVPSIAPLWVSLTVSPLRVGRLRRLATKLRLAPEVGPVRLRWQMVLLESPKTDRVTLRLPPSARGAYRVVLSIEPSDAPPVLATRDLFLTP